MKAFLTFMILFGSLIAREPIDISGFFSAKKIGVVGVYGTESRAYIIFGAESKGWLAILDTLGEIIKEETIIEPAGLIFNAFEPFPIIELGNGNLAVAYIRSPNFSLHLIIINKTGNIVAGPIEIAPLSVYHVSMVVAGGKIILAYITFDIFDNMRLCQYDFEENVLMPPARIDTLTSRTYNVRMEVANERIFLLRFHEGKNNSFSLELNELLTNGSLVKETHITDYDFGEFPFIDLKNGLNGIGLVRSKGDTLLFTLKKESGFEPAKSVLDNVLDFEAPAVSFLTKRARNQNIVLGLAGVKKFYYELISPEGNVVQRPEVIANGRVSSHAIAPLGRANIILVSTNLANGEVGAFRILGYHGINPDSLPPPPVHPYGYELYQNYPNPFNAGTSIDIHLNQAAEVNLTVYNLLGQKIRTLANKKLYAGWHKFEFAGKELPSGIYFCLMRAEGVERVRKMVLLK